MIHVYAFAECLVDLPASAALEGALLERMAIEDVDAVFSRRVDATSRDVVQRDALIHGTVVEALRDCSAAVLPVRFGDAVRDEPALAELLRERLPNLRRTFDRVRGCVEIAVHVQDHVGTVAERPANGTEYMRLRAAEESRRRASIDALHGAVSALTRDARVERDRFSASYLVAVDQLDRVRAAIDGFENDHPDLTVVCTGPWAPFSFGSEAA